MTLSLPGMEPPCEPALSQFDTPPPLAAALCELVSPAGRVVLEPSAGRGNLVAAALDAGAARVIAVELDPVRCAVLRDRFASAPVMVIEGSFLDVRLADLARAPDVVLGNPPYDDGADTDHVAHMLTFLAERARLGLLLRTVFLHGQERRERIWSRVELRALEPVSARVKFGEESGKIDVSLFELEARRPAEFTNVIVRFR